VDTDNGVYNLLMNPRRSVRGRICEINANVRHMREERLLSTQTRKQSFRNACVIDEKWTHELLVVACLGSWNVRTCRVCENEVLT